MGNFEENQDLLCDFCTRPVLKGHATRVVGHPVAGFMKGADIEVHFDHSDVWCACRYCFDLVNHSAWELLTKRVMMSLGCPGDAPMELLLRVTYSKAFDVDLVKPFMLRLNEPYNSPGVTL